MYGVYACRIVVMSEEGKKDKKKNEMIIIIRSERKAYQALIGR